MTVPYSDIGKQANDLLGKDYPLGISKLEINTTTPNNVKFTVSGSKDNKSGLIVSDLKAKYTDKAQGLTFTESWSTSNVIGAQLELQDSLLKGLKLDLVGTLLPEKGTKNAKVGFEFKQGHVYTRSSLDLFKGPTVFADATVGSNGVVVGADVAYDVSDAKLTKINAGVGYIAPLYSVSLLASNKASVYSVSYYHKVNADVEAGAKATWNKMDTGVAVEVGAKLTLDSGAFVKAKVDNIGRLGLGYSQVLRPGIKLGLGGLFDTSRLSSDVHKVGFSLSFDA